MALEFLLLSELLLLGDLLRHGLVEEGLVIELHTGAHGFKEHESTRDRCEVGEWVRLYTIEARSTKLRP